MGTLVVQQPVLTGVVEVAPVSAAAGGDVFPVISGASYLLRIVNGGGSPITATLNDPSSQQPSGATAWNPDVAIPVTNGTTKSCLIGPSDVTRLRNATTGNIEVAYSGVTTVSVQVQRVA